ncbi:MAG: hypothetical protein ACLUIX_03455 [Oscillospiraceae bacterium]
MENLQRRDLDCWEEAEACPGSSPAMGSVRRRPPPSGCSQPAVANKLRVTRLPDSVRQFLQENATTERHAAHCAAGDGGRQLAAAQVFCGAG